MLERQIVNSHGYVVEIVDDIDSPAIESRRLRIPARDGITDPSMISYKKLNFCYSATDRLADTLLTLLAPYGNFEHLVAQYSPRYRLAFTLLNEDATAGKAILDWDIQNSLARAF
jgi:GPI-anchor transamidase subunit S